MQPRLCYIVKLLKRIKKFQIFLVKQIENETKYSLLNSWNFRKQLFYLLFDLFKT